jgi:hypothetical protein
MEKNKNLFIGLLSLIVLLLCTILYNYNYVEYNKFKVVSSIHFPYEDEKGKFSTLYSYAVKSDKRNYIIYSEEFRLEEGDELILIRRK